MGFNWKAAGAAAGQSISQIGGQLVSAELIKQRDMRLATIRQQETAQSQGFTAEQNATAMANSNEQAQLSRDAQVLNTDKTIAARSSEAEKTRAHDETMFGKRENADLLSQNVALAGDLTVQNDKQAHDLLLLRMNEQKKQAGAAGIAPKEITEIQETAWKLAKDIIPAPQTGMGQAADSTLSDAATQISQRALQIRATGGVPDMNAITNEVAGKVNEAAKYQAFMDAERDPTVEDGRGMFGRLNIEQAKGYLSERVPPDASRDYMNRFLLGKGWSEARRNKLLNTLKPTQPVVKQPPTEQDIAYLRANPEKRALFIQQFGSLPEGL